jgi:hypothetical protein
MYVVVIPTSQKYHKNTWKADVSSQTMNDGWCEIVLYNLHNDLFFVLFACWWLRAKPKHVALNYAMYNKTGNVRINVTLRRVRETIVAVEKQ